MIIFSMSSFGLKIFFVCLWIKPQYAFYRSNTKCSTKRIMCLDDVSYRFCFNTASSTLVYGSIKHCPKSTVCCEDEGTKLCIKQKNLNGIKIPESKNFTDIEQSVTIVSNESETVTNTNIIYQQVTTTTENVPPLFLPTNKKLTPIKQYRKEPPHSPNHKVSPIPKRKKPSTKNPKVQTGKKRKQPLLLTLKNYLLKSKRKSSHKRKHSNITQSGTKSSAKLNKMQYSSKTKKPLKFHSKTKPVSSPIKKPLKKVSIQKTNSSTIKSTQDVNLGEQFSKDVYVKKDNSFSSTIKSSSTTGSNSASSITTHTPSVIIEESIMSSSTPTTIIYSGTISTTTSPKITTKSSSTVPEETSASKRTTTEATKTTKIKIIAGATSGSPCYVASIPSTLSPCSFFQRFYQSSDKTFDTISLESSTGSTTTTATGRPTLCRIPAKYPSTKCDEYHECKQVMWWYKWLLLKCKKGYAFDPFTSKCIIDASCI